MSSLKDYLQRFFCGLFLTSVLVLAAFYFDVAEVNLTFSGLKIQNWTRADVLNNSKFQQLSNLKFKDVLTNSKFPRPNHLPCDWKPEAWNKTTRSLCFLACDTTSDDDGVHRNISSSVLICKKVADSADTQSITSLTPGEAPCLKHFINQHCYGKNKTIPRVVHYVRFGSYNLTLDAFFGMYSAARFLQPCLILIYGKTVAPGPYWRMLLHLVPNIMHVQMDRPREIFGRKINVVQHSSDVARLKILLEYGGIYADFDQLFLHSFDDLLDKDTVLGLEIPRKTLNNALIVTRPKSEFLQIWLSKYTTFNDRRWSDHSTRLPFNLYRQYPHLIHLVYTFFPPVSRRWSDLYTKRSVPHFSLTTGTQYGLHLYIRINQNFVRGKARLDKQDNVVGQAIRYILYGNQTACMQPSTGATRVKTLDRKKIVNPKSKEDQQRKQEGKKRRA